MNIEHNEYSESRLEDDFKNIKTEELPSGNDPSYLPYTKEFNWGAFLLNCFWLPFFKLDAKSIVLFIVNLLFCGIPSMFVCYQLGRDGGTIAWKYRKFKDVEEYKSVLKVWTKWGIAVHILLLIITVIFCVALFFGIRWFMTEILPQFGII